ncbi:virB8 family protein [Luteimonas kalidii]|uniref:Type IV secretion system protein n=1 Tax=Luteimonas kalidii TaxID=3042025 RepID=A0ABT6JV47_9GAMM|nr:type IV secretion system protein [Luteimonas kalidii]MDH5834564.1 type IV secretion system protein [Luteimonas kalidii]
MFRRRDTTPAVEQAVGRGVNYEVSLADRARRSERRAWWVAACALAMSLILAGGYFYFLPLKEKVPYLVMADPYTGTATVARLVGNFQDPTITTQEAINKSNVAQFVMARESYDTGLIGQQNWRQTLTMAGPHVAPAFRALHAASNPNRPYNQYGTSRAVRVRILSISLVPAAEGQPPRGATVRFQRSLYSKQTGNSQVMDGKIATLQFAYDPELRFDERDRLLNPLGFRVSEYRVDNDYGMPPADEPAFPAMSAEPIAGPDDPAAVDGQVDARTDHAAPSLGADATRGGIAGEGP